jgi:heat shock transcription factor, other eukaryote
MRASERKNKSPSEYSNPYFRRGHPDLLWLIQKPKNVGGPSKRKGKGEGDQNDDDVDDYIEDTPTTGATSRAARPGQLTLGNTATDSALTQDQFKSVQRELAAIRNHQTQISRMMGQLKREQDQLYGQAATFQDQHNRHENSINAILTFLATVYNRSLQGHDNSQNIANLFQNAMPGETPMSGNVVDVGDYNFNDGLLDGSPKPFRKAPLLLTDGTGQQGRASTLSPRTSAANSPFPQRAQPLRGQRGSVLSPAVEEVFDPGVNSPDNNVAGTSNQQSRGSLPSRDMMSMIQNANARNNSGGNSPSTPAQDFSNVLNSLESSNSGGPLSNSQRADMLRMINNTTNQPAGNDNALINSTPPPGPANFHRRLASTQADLDQLAKLQAEQDKSVQNLTNLLQPLSPTGSIPGIHDNQSLPPPPLDIDDFLNHNEYFADFPSDGNGNYDFGSTGLNDNQQNDNSNLDFNDYRDDDELFSNIPDNRYSNTSTNFGFDGTNDAPNASSPFEDHAGGGRIESVPSSETTTPKSDGDASRKVSGASAVSSSITRGKGRKLSAADDERSQSKRARP